MGFLGKQEKYKTIQVVLKEALFGVGSRNLSEVDRELNRWYDKGYCLHSMSTTFTESKGVGEGDRIIVTCVLELEE